MGRVFAGLKHQLGYGENKTPILRRSVLYLPMVR